MKICIFTLGTRGDVQPYVSLAKAAVQQGHCAVICTGESFRELIQKNGVEFRRTESDLMAFAKTDMGKAILQEPLKNWKLAMRASKEILNPAYRKTLDTFFEAVKDLRFCVGPGWQPLSRVSGRKRYNTLDFASKIVCQGASPFGNLRQQNRRYAALSASIPPFVVSTPFYGLHVVPCKLT